MYFLKIELRKIRVPVYCNFTLQLHNCDSVLHPYSKDLIKSSKCLKVMLSYQVNMLSAASFRSLLLKIGLRKINVPVYCNFALQKHDYNSLSYSCSKYVLKSQKCLKVMLTRFFSIAYFIYKYFPHLM